MEYASAQEHVPDIECTIQTIKERFRCQYTRLPYGRIPIIMVDVLVQECAKWLNIFPPKGGISKYYLPMSILNGKQLDYEKHCKIPCGTYVQAIQENEPTNTTKPRTIGCIYLRSRLSKHVVYELMNLQSGKMITRRKVTPIPISKDVGKRVKYYAKRDNMSEDINFISRKRVINKLRENDDESTGVYTCESDEEDMEED